MKNEEELISDFTEGCLDENQEESLIDSLREDPGFAENLREDLITSDLISRELKSSRSDKAFCEAVESRIDATEDTDVGKPSLKSQTSKSQKVIFFWAAAAVLFISLGLVWMFVKDTGSAPVIANIKETGQGFKIYRGEKEIDADKNFSLLEGDRIFGTVADQKLTFRFFDGTTSILHGLTTAVVERSANEGKLVKVQTGTASFKVTPQKNAFLVQTRHGSMTVVGTEFDVAVSETQTSLKVTEGVVEFINNNKKRITVKAGESALASSNQNNFSKIVYLPVAADTFIGGGKFRHTGNGSSEILLVQNTDLDVSSLIRFDLGKIPLNVSSAKLRLYAESVSKNGSLLSLQFLSDDSWKENVISGNNSPRFIPEEILTWKPVEGNFTELDVTSLVKKELSGDKQLSMRIISLKKVNGTKVIFPSKENKNENLRPVLIISYK